MRCVLRSLIVAICLAFAVVAAGCGPSGGKGPAKTAPPSGVAPQKPADAPKQAEAGTETLPEGLAELPEADRALAEKQKVCPVSGKPLGSMGTPVKITVKGKTLFLCCPRCEPKMTKDPDKYLAKLDAASQE